MNRTSNNENNDPSKSQDRKQKEQSKSNATSKLRGKTVGKGSKKIGARFRKKTQSVVASVDGVNDTTTANEVVAQRVPSSAAGNAGDSGASVRTSKGLSSEARRMLKKAAKDGKITAAADPYRKEYRT